MSNKPNQRKEYAAHYNRVERYASLLDGVYAQSAAEFSKLALSVNHNPSEAFRWSDYPETKRKADELLRGVASNIQTVVVNGATAEWEESNLKNDRLARSVVGKGLEGDFKQYFNNNADALQSFIGRKQKGLGLSQKVWKLSEQYKSDLELALSVGLSDGRSAAELSRDIRGYLKEPAKLFRRIRDKDGNLQLSQAAKAYHPGAGTYRSSYKNAMRLTRTEINMAYRTADSVRYGQPDFVVGFEVKRSGRGYDCSVCESLAGKYPKDFKFVGWHPQCRCYVIPILKTDEEFWAWDGRGEAPTSSVNEVTDVPSGYKGFIADNKERITKAEKNGTLPYFMRDNKKYVGAEQPINKNVTPRRVKTDSEKEDIQDRWNSRHAAIIMGIQPIDTIDKVQGVINRFLELYPSETNGKAIDIGTYKKKPMNGGFSIMRANSPQGTIELNNVCYPQMSDSPYTRLRTSFDKIRQGKTLSFDEEYSIESLYHEILHCKAKEWKRLLPHNHGDYKRTAMETINQFVSRHEYPNFIKRLGGKAINHTEVLERGIGYSDWVGNFRNYLSVAKIDEAKAFNYFKDKLLNQSYDSLDDVLASYIKENAGSALNGYSDRDILESLQVGGVKWKSLMSLLKTK